MNNNQFAKVIKQRGVTFTGFWGYVVSSAAGPPKTVTITVNGGSTNVTCRYDSQYTPTNGDTVYGRMTLGRLGPDYVVEGKLA